MARTIHNIHGCIIIDDPHATPVEQPRSRRLPPGQTLSSEEVEILRLQEEEKERKENPEQTRSRRQAPGSAPVRYSGAEWPRGGHVKLLQGEEDNCGARAKKRFVSGGAIWVDTALCVYCQDRLAGNCVSWIAFRDHVKHDLGVDEKGRVD